MSEDLKEWPPIEGRYNIGNKKSPVAVCTNASIEEIKINPQKVAIWGKTVTENIGIEKIIQNIVSNPNIRYLVLCGRVSKGHFVSQTIESLIKNGVDENKRIIDSKGNMPYLKNLDMSVIERFRKQVTPVNIEGETDSEKIEKIIDKLLKKKEGEFSGKSIDIKKIKEIKSYPAQWMADPNGYFLISVNPERKKIIAEHHYLQGKVNLRIIGDNAKEISDTIARQKLVGQFPQQIEHSMYLARELQKAEIALKNHLDYEQDTPLFIKTVKDDKKGDEYEWHD